MKKKKKKKKKLNMLLLLRSHFSLVRLCLTPETAAHQASPSLRFSRKEYWSVMPFLIPRDRPNSEIEPMSLVSSLLAGRFFTMCHPGRFSSVQSLSRVRLFATPWLAARQASLSITISRSSLAGSYWPLRVWNHQMSVSAHSNCNKTSFLAKSQNLA